MNRIFAAAALAAVLCLGQGVALAGGCPDNCNGHGSCDTGTNTCTCFTGYAGPSCGFCAPNYYNYPNCTFCEATITCSGNGTCTANGFCSCNTGWIGTDCSIPFCAGGCGNGICVSPGQCQCFPGWSGPNCDVPATVPTVSAWGLVILSLTGLIAGTKLFAARKHQATA